MNYQDKCKLFHEKLYKRGRLTISPSLLNNYKYAVIGDIMPAKEEILNKILGLDIDENSRKRMDRGTAIENAVYRDLGLFDTKTNQTFISDVASDIVECAVNHVRGYVGRFSNYSESTLSLNIYSQGMVTKELEIKIPTETHEESMIVDLLGFYDLKIRTTLIDIKYTKSAVSSGRPSSSIESGTSKKNSLQHKIYLYCLKDQLVKNFEYLTITDSGGLYIESYRWHENYILDIKNACIELMSFYNNLGTY